MDKNKIINHIAGDATPQEEEEVLSWIKRDKRNKEYYIWLKNLYVSQSLPKSQASEEDMNLIKANMLKTAALKSKRRGMYIYITSGIAVAALFVLFLTAIGYIDINGKSSLEKRENHNYNDIYDRTLTAYTEKGIKAKVILPDSSIVWLNSDSKISYPDKFNDSIRSIDFSGEAYFEVKKDASRPMIIRTNKNYIVRVLGTSFNLRSYDNDNELKTTLYNGIIDIISTNKENDKVIRIHPNESIKIKGNNTIYSKCTEHDAQMDVAWTKGQLIFENTEFRDVVKMLERWHGVKIIVKDNAILGHKITAEFQSESIIQIAEMIRYCARIDYEMKDNTIIFKSR